MPAADIIHDAVKNALIKAIEVLVKRLHLSPLVVNVPKEEIRTWIN
jgi:hypothetical protein